MKLYINANEEGKTPDECLETMTVGELVRHLEEFEDDTPIYLQHGGGRYYGSISAIDLEPYSGEDDDD